MKEWLKNYKNKDCKTWIGTMTQRIVFLWFYKVMFFIAITIIGASGTNFNFGVVGNNIFIGLFYIGFLGLLAIANNPRNPIYFKKLSDKNNTYS